MIKISIKMKTLKRLKTPHKRKGTKKKVNKTKPSYELENE